MAKRKMVLHNLLKNSISAYYAAIEIHNKPNITYRYETTTILLINTWELGLKAFIRKYIKSKSIFDNKDESKTISLLKAINIVNDFLINQNSINFFAIKENLLLLEKYRDSIIHYYSESFEPIIFMLTARCAVNYVEFIKKYFSKDIIYEEGFSILPLGFKLPFKPEDFLSKISANYKSSVIVKNLINEIIKITNNLKEQGVEDSIVIGFNIYLESVKKINNSDLLVAITSIDKADTTFVKTSKYQIVDDPNAMKVCLSEEDINSNYPLDYKNVCKKCREEITNFKQNIVFNDIMKELFNNSTFCHTRKLDPRSKNTSTKTFYSEAIINEIKNEYKQRG